MTVLTHEYRGAILENIHCGRICVVDESCRIAASVGDAEAPTYCRSASKPFQTLPVIIYGLDKKYGLTERELTIMAGSHAGEDMHLEAILGILEKTGIPEDDLIMRPAFPAHKQTYERMIKNGAPPRKSLHNCAGKHLAAMMLARMLTGDHRDYWRPECAAQREIMEWISHISSHPVDEIGVGVDGCGVPVFALPLRCMAIAFMRLACPDRIEIPELSAAAAKLGSLINKHPLMMRGTGFFCSMINEDANIVGKGGAEGVYGFGLRKERLGVSLKNEDGTEDTWPIVIAEILRQLEYGDAAVLARLDGFKPAVKLNDNDTEVGYIKTVFKLR